MSHIIVSASHIFGCCGFLLETFLLCVSFSTGVTLFSMSLEVLCRIKMPLLGPSEFVGGTGKFSPSVLGALIVFNFNCMDVLVAVSCEICVSIYILSNDETRGLSFCLYLCWAGTCWHIWCASI